MKIAQQFFNKFIALKKVFKTYPCELALFFLVAIADVIYGAQIDPEEYMGYLDRYEERLGMIPFLLAIIYASNVLTQGKHYRFLYFLLSAGAAVVLLFFPDYQGVKWLFGQEGDPSELLYIASIAIVLLARLQFKNQAFTKDSVTYVGVICQTLLFSFITYLMLEGVYHGIKFLFNFTDCYDWDYILTILASFIIFPILLFLFLHHALQKNETIKNKILEVFVRYIFSPIGILYALILNVYALVILIRSELPEGFVATQVITLVLSVYFFKMLHPVFEQKNRILDFIFKHIAWLLIIPAILFWMGVRYRIGEYGITENRLYLIIFGVIMVVWIVADLTRKGYNYFALFAAIAILSIIMLYIPFASPYQIAIKHNAKNIMQFAEKIEGLREEYNEIEGRQFLLELDSVSSKKLAASVDYISRYNINIDSATAVSYGLNLKKIKNLDSYFHYYKQSNNTKYFTVLLNSKYDFKIDQFYRFETMLYIPYGGSTNDSTHQYSINYNGENYFKKDAQFVLDNVVKNAGIKIDSIFYNDTGDNNNFDLIYEDEEVIIIFKRISIEITTEGDVKPNFFNCQYLLVKKEEHEEK